MHGEQIPTQIKERQDHWEHLEPTHRAWSDRCANAAATRRQNKLNRRCGQVQKYEIRDQVDRTYRRGLVSTVNRCWPNVLYPRTSRVRAIETESEALSERLLSKYCGGSRNPAWERKERQTNRHKRETQHFQLEKCQGQDKEKRWEIDCRREGIKTEQIA